MALWRRSSSWLTSCSRAPAGIGGGNEAKVSPEVAPEDAAAEQGGLRAEAGDEERWSRLLPELLTDIVRRVDAGAERWPPRRDVVACACVCRRWRDAAVAVVRPPLECGRITFPSSLKQVRPDPGLLPIAAAPIWLTRRPICALLVAWSGDLAGVWSLC
ncbi:hypothetical protein ACQJBY_008054 [Aegilops geniculata]